MGGRAVRVAIAIVLVGLGWAVGTCTQVSPTGTRAQTTAWDFELAVDAPVGTTNVECLRGCALQGARDSGNPNAQTFVKYTFSCSGQERCSARVNGFLRR